MLPSPQDFAEHLAALGLSLSAAPPLARKVVVYNQPGCFSAARCWWTFRALGYPMPVYVLNGGE
jgi:thiosulfate/3-mercaptopyruvate sulfurtransferase